MGVRNFVQEPSCASDGQRRCEKPSTHICTAVQGSDSTRSHIAYTLLTHPGMAVTIRRVSNVAVHSSSISRCTSPLRDTGTPGTRSIGRFTNAAKHSAAMLYTSVSGYHGGRVSEAMASRWRKICGRLRNSSRAVVFLRTGRGETRPLTLKNRLSCSMPYLLGAYLTASGMVIWGVIKISPAIQSLWFGGTDFGLPFPDVTRGPPPRWISHFLLGFTGAHQASPATLEDHFSGRRHIELRGKVIRFSGHRGKKVCSGEPDNEIWMILQSLRHEFQLDGWRKQMARHTS
jgi:hypothetical protein